MGDWHQDYLVSPADDLLGLIPEGSEVTDLDRCQRLAEGIDGVFRTEVAAQYPGWPPGSTTDGASVDICFRCGRGDRWVIAGIAVKLPFCSSPGVPAGAVPAVGGQGHRQPGRADGADRRRVPRPAGPRGRRRGLPRSAAAAARRDLDHPAAGQRRLVRAGPAAQRQAWPAGAQGPPSSANPRTWPPQPPGGGSRSASTAAARPLTWPRWVSLVRQLRQRPRPVRAGPGSRLSQALQPGIVHHRRRLQRRWGGRALRHAVVHRAIERNEQATDGVGQAATGCRRPSSGPCPSGCSHSRWSSSGTPCPVTTPTTSPSVVRLSRDTTPRPSRHSKTCSPSSARPSSWPVFPALAPVRPTLTYCAITPWPAPPQPRSCETRGSIAGAVQWLWRRRGRCRPEWILLGVAACYGPEGEGGV